MIKLRPIIFTLGLVLSKLALFMWLPTLLGHAGQRPAQAEGTD